MDRTVFYKGSGCVGKSGEVFGVGKKALIVTGRSSAKKCGALDDVLSVLNRLSVGYEIYDGMTENPPLSCCEEAGRLGVEAGCDFVIGIGGGSVIDGAKAASVLVANPDSAAEEIFDPAVNCRALPIIAIPTTAGTGSEGNKYSVITVGDKKRSFASDATLPICAFLDGTYLRTLNREYTLSTAIDAFCHCIESYLSPKATELSSSLALEGGRLIWRELISNDFMPKDDDAAGLSPESRQRMIEGAAMGGEAIMYTGTGFTHPLGYGITLDFGVPHGFACGAFTEKYIEYNRTSPEGEARVARFAEYIGTKPELIGSVIGALSDINITLSEEQIEDMVRRVSGARNYANSQCVIDDGDALEIMRELFGAF